VLLPERLRYCYQTKLPGFDTVADVIYVVCRETNNGTTTTQTSAINDGHKQKQKKISHLLARVFRRMI